MGFIINFIIITVFFLIGVGITSFTLLPILIVLVFGIPTTKKLEKMKLLKEKNGIIKGYLASLLILPIIFLVTILITISFFPSGLAWFLIGGGMVLLLGIAQIGKSDGNIRDYMETNKQHFLDNPKTVFHAIMHL